MDASFSPSWARRTSEYASAHGCTEHASLHGPQAPRPCSVRGGMLGGVRRQCGWARRTSSGGQPPNLHIEVLLATAFMQLKGVSAKSYSKTVGKSRLFIDRTRGFRYLITLRQLPPSTLFEGGKAWCLPQRLLLPNHKARPDARPSARSPRRWSCRRSARLSVQKESFERFMGEGLAESFAEFSPIENSAPHPAGHLWRPPVWRPGAHHRRVPREGHLLPGPPLR